MDILVIDVGGTHVKLCTRNQSGYRFESSDRLTAATLVEQVRDATREWHYDVVSIGYPGVVSDGQPTAEPGNLGNGWVGFDFEGAFGCPVRLVNDAVMQAVGAYDGGRMLFLGLGTGLGSTLVTEHVVVPLELGNLPFRSGGTMAERVGRQALEDHGQDRWQDDVHDVVDVLSEAFVADYVVIGGGNAKLLDEMPEAARRGGNEDAFTGGFRLWDEIVEPHDREPHRVWRVVR